MKTLNDLNNFNSISIKLASPERIREWSYGEVTKPETINYRTGRSERNGLFDERIFGPEKDYECYCGKYRRIRYKDIVCEKCGVEVTRSIVRRERMGHIELATPVSHIWFLRGVPSRMSVLLNISSADLEKVIYFTGYIITKVNVEEKDSIIKNLESEYKTKIKAIKNDSSRDELKELLLNTKKEISEIKEGKVLNEINYHHFSRRYGSCFEANIGAEEIYKLFQNLDLKKLKAETELMIEKAGTIEKEKLQKRLSLIRSMIKSNVRPEWMFLKVIPIIPPALRPMVALDGGRHATSDLNDLYRRVINRNNRLKKLQEIGAPDVILRNEKRILQEAVDSLIDNSISRQSDSVAMNQAQRRALKSLADSLKSKQGLFRQNLLGKRVDYSGRSVIVVGPQLKLSQCGLPKHMALELFRPFVISKLLESELAFNIRGANKLIEEGIPEVWAILEKVIDGKYVLLNRAPTLHRLGIQAFNPVLIEGNAIQVHPLVCSAFNADFDGDQMAVYVPLSKQAQEESRQLMASTVNLLKPQDGNPIVTPGQDIVLGCYWMTKDVDSQRGEGKIFASPNHAITAYYFKEVSFRAKVKILGTNNPKYNQFNGKLFESSVGRLLFNSSLPNSFPYLNEEITKKRMSQLVDELIRLYGIEETSKVLDKIKNFGFEYVTKSGITWGIDNVVVPKEKETIVESGRQKEEEVRNQYDEGLLSKDERYRKILMIWEKVKKEIEVVLPSTLDKEGSAYDILTSGARGTLHQLSQMIGMKGLIISPTGRTIDFPVIPSYKEGLSPLEYFISTHGARKGQADTALNTAKAGYLTRRLVDVAQDIVITEKDCKTKEYKIATKENISGIEISLAKNIFGRILAKEIKSNKGKILYPKGHLITKEDSQVIDNLGIKEVFIRTPLVCKTLHGLCQQCYGLDLGRNYIINTGEAVGIVAAQAIGEPGTQLTLRTFHAGGVAGGVDITVGLPRVEEIFERRPPKYPAIVSITDGEVIEVKDLGVEKLIVVLSDKQSDESVRRYKKTVTKSGDSMEYTILSRRSSVVKKGDKVKKGQLLTDGSADILDVFKYGGQIMAEDYIIEEINKVYELQGASISRKHLEIIVRQMFSRRKIIETGDTTFSLGEIVEKIALIEENNRTEEQKEIKAKADTILLGISEVSLTTTSWLSAASFQSTNRVLINNAINGGVDNLRGLKENVIIGRLIPAGTGIEINKKEIKEED